jgi:hypothetical protein
LLLPIIIIITTREPREKVRRNVVDRGKKAEQEGGEQVSSTKMVAQGIGAWEAEERLNS